MESTSSKRSDVQSRVFLKNGIGTVAAEDYDEKVHGKALVLTDEEYHARLGVKVAPAPAAPRSTVANLHTYDSTTVAPAAPAPVVAAVPAAVPVGQAVATVAKAEDGKKPDAPKA